MFKNIKEAHEHYKYISSHRFGTIGNDTGVIRSYSNGEKGDIIKFLVNFVPYFLLI